MFEKFAKCQFFIGEWLISVAILLSFAKINTLENNYVIYRHKYGKPNLSKHMNVISIIIIGSK